jgi:hypothetical protein
MLALLGENFCGRHDNPLSAIGAFLHSMLHVQDFSTSLP